MKKIAITGGIGSGKSFICNIFKSLNVPIFDSDSFAKYLMISDIEIISSLKKEFGDDIYQDKFLNKPKLAEIIFKDKSALDKLNSIVHPIVRKKFKDWCDDVEMNINPIYVVFESAIVFESNLSEIFDCIITVYTDLEIRIGRAIIRDNVSREKILERINNQLSDQYKIDNSDFIIFNNENDLNKSYLNLIPQIFTIHNILIDKNNEI